MDSFGHFVCFPALLLLLYEVSRVYREVGSNKGREISVWGIMRLLILVCGFTVISSLSFSALAQDNPSDIKSSDTQTPHEQGEEDKTQADNNSDSDKAEGETDSFNMDEFFKRAEENAEKGFGCNRPPDPVS